MARPEHIADIELSPVEFGTIDFAKIATDPALLKGYTAFLEAVSKAGATVNLGYGGASFSRFPSFAEQADQLKSEQVRWDEGKKQYDIMASVGKCEYSYLESAAQRWAETEKMPFPPECEPLSDFDAVLRDIDEAVDA